MSKEIADGVRDNSGMYVLFDVSVGPSFTLSCLWIAGSMDTLIRQVGMSPKISFLTMYHSRPTH